LPAIRPISISGDMAVARPNEPAIKAPVTTEPEFADSASIPSIGAHGEKPSAIPETKHIRPPLEIFFGIGQVMWKRKIMIKPRAIYNMPMP
jgi:hypothetical protein